MRSSRLPSSVAAPRPSRLNLFRALSLLLTTVSAQILNASSTCPAGTWQDGMVGCRQCAEGKYSPTVGITRADDCLPCPQGRVCGIKGMTSVDESNPCPAGHMCGVNTTQAMTLLAASISQGTSRLEPRLMTSVLGAVEPAATAPPLASELSPGLVAQLVVANLKGTSELDSKVKSQMEAALAKGTKHLGPDALARLEASIAGGTSTVDPRSRTRCMLQIVACVQFAGRDNPIGNSSV